MVFLALKEHVLDLKAIEKAKKYIYDLSMYDSDNIMNIFGAALRELRLNAGFTQEKLAELLGMQAQSIARIETGKRFVSSEVLAKICNFFQVEPYVLFLKKHQTYTPEELNHISEINSKLNKIYNILVSK